MAEGKKSADDPIVQLCSSVIEESKLRHTITRISAFPPFAANDHRGSIQWRHIGVDLAPLLPRPRPRPVVMSEKTFECTKLKLCVCVCDENGPFVRRKSSGDASLPHNKARAARREEFFDLPFTSPTYSVHITFMPERASERAAARHKWE